MADKHPTLVGDLGVVAALAIFIAGMCLLLALYVPFELMVSRPR